MKKVISLALAVVLALSLAACGANNNGDQQQSGGDQAPEITSALELLETVWNDYGDDEKFPAVGGDFSEENNVENGPGNYDLTDREALDAVLGLPQTAQVDQAASLIHMMNANTFTAAAYHATEDAEALATALRDNIQQRQWMCGFPDKVVVITVNEVVVAMYGHEDLINAFRDQITGAYSAAVVAFDEAIDF